MYQFFFSFFVCFFFFGSLSKKPIPKAGASRFIAQISKLTLRSSSLPGHPPLFTSTLPQDFGSAAGTPHWLLDVRSVSTGEKLPETRHSLLWVAAVVFARSTNGHGREEPPRRLRCSHPQARRAAPRSRCASKPPLFFYLFYFWGGSFSKNSIPRIGQVTSSRSKTALSKAHFRLDSAYPLLVTQHLALNS